MQNFFSDNNSQKKSIFAMMKAPTTIKHSLAIFIHVIGWAIVLLMPILIDWGSEKINWIQYLQRLPVPLCFLAIFYINYFYLIDKYLFRKKIRQYVLINLFLIIGVEVGIHLFHEHNRKRQEVIEAHNASNRPLGQIPDDSITINKQSLSKSNTVKFGPPPPLDKKFDQKDREFGKRFKFFFALRNLFSLFLIVALAVAIKITGRWYRDEAIKTQLERSKTEAELKNLKNQINPHFLLNTLNNIYALIAFDTDKAQQAIQDLSKMLRYILYENQTEFVPIQREIEFIKNYIELMKIRLTQNVTVTTNLIISKTSTICVAPLIFISLIENAFKHGISPTQYSFIDILLEESEDHKIICRITNSYYPKPKADKSGSGIGLGQVSQRLELLYKGRYIWHQGVSEDGKEYNSLLIINPAENDGEEENESL